MVLSTRSERNSKLNPVSFIERGSAGKIVGGNVLISPSLSIGREMILRSEETQLAHHFLIENAHQLRQCLLKTSFVIPIGHIFDSAIFAHFDRPRLIASDDRLIQLNR